MFIYFIFRLIKSPKLKFRLKNYMIVQIVTLKKLKYLLIPLLSGYSTLTRRAKGPNLLRYRVS